MAKIKCIGGPQDGLVVTLYPLPKVDEWHPDPLGKGGYRFDRDAMAFRWEWKRAIVHESDGGHTFVFVFTSRVKLVRYMGHLAQTLTKVWSSGIFGWKDAAEVNKQVREIVRKDPNND